MMAPVDTLGINHARCGLVFLKPSQIISLASQVLVELKRVSTVASSKPTLFVLIVFCLWYFVSSITKNQRQESVRHAR